jgi:glycosyltransferase involved in cell wall biosynthesis
MTVTSATVLVCTYNRAALLRDTLAALQSMTRPANCAVEIIVVDNNSTDNTSGVIAALQSDPRVPIVSLHERKQGKSFALNRGLAAARGDIIALTDDDVIPDCEWLCRIVEAFRSRAVTFVFGKVLPRWSITPPPELLTTPAQDIWGPLALVDYGDVATDYTAASCGQRLPIGANLAFARHALVAAGGWRTDLGKVDNTLISGEDHEIFSRLRRLDLYAGYYDPDIVVRHYVPARRLTRAYFRDWFYWSGRTRALMLDALYPEIDLERVPRIGGVPRFLFRQALQQFGRWLWTRRPGAAALPALVEELRLLQYAGLIAQCSKTQRAVLRAAAPAGRHKHDAREYRRVGKSHTAPVSPRRNDESVAAVEALLLLKDGPE